MRTILKKGSFFYQKLKKSNKINRLQKSDKFLSAETKDDYAGLRKRINSLNEYIDRDYCFLDLPDYNNIGDHLICKGSLNFLNTLSYKNNYIASTKSFKPSKINRNDLIILQGGGNFGDLWYRHQEYREYIVRNFQKNKIIIFPQTVFFQSTKKLKQAVNIFSDHPDLTICTRDWRSYELAENNFTKNNILLIPDMAFYLFCGITKRTPKKFNEILYMKRRDKELKRDAELSSIKKYDIKDWPSFDLNYLNFIPNKYKQWDFYTNTGILFMASYDLVISTRLHGCILAVLLGIPTILLDNVYGKNKTYYETWMKDIPHCYFAENGKELEKHYFEIIQ